MLAEPFNESNVIKKDLNTAEDLEVTTIEIILLSA